MSYYKYNGQLQATKGELLRRSEDFIPLDLSYPFGVELSEEELKKRLKDNEEWQYGSGYLDSVGPEWSLKCILKCGGCDSYFVPVGVCPVCQRVYKDMDEAFENSAVLSFYYKGLPRGEQTAAFQCIKCTPRMIRSFTEWKCPKCGDKNKVFDTVQWADEKSSCFIATAVYGIDSHEVGVLRKFRDRRLLKNKTGKLFVKAYYKMSPFVARIIAKRQWLRSLVKPVLDYIVRRCG